MAEGGRRPQHQRLRGHLRARCRRRLRTRSRAFRSPELGRSGAACARAQRGGHSGRLVFVAVDRRRRSGLEPFAASRAIYLPDGRAPVTRERAAEQRLHNPALAKTLRRLAEAGPRDFYEGEIARALVADLAAGGCVIDAEDLAAYRPRFLAPATLDYRGTKLYAMPGLSGGPTYLAALAALAADPRPPRRPDPDAFLAYARAITSAYAVRLATYGHAGATNDPGCTSHVSVIDADGNMVALTNISAVALRRQGHAAWRLAF